MRRFGLRSIAAVLSVVLVFGLAIAGFSVVSAQDDDVTVDGPGTPRPGHIHAGSCENLGDVVFALNNATIDNLDADYTAGDDDVEFAGSENANPVYVSETTISDVTLDDILAADHAINFHLSGDEIETYITCGDIGGFVRDGELYVGLVPVPGSTGPQFAGSAVLSNNDDGGVDVEVQFVQVGEATGGTTAPAATPDATPITVPDESAAPSDDESAAPSADESAAPSDEESAAPSAEESAAPSDEESAAPSEAATPTT
jgi:hypothetical protein